jgi:hypothetical protein
MIEDEAWPSAQAFTSWAKPVTTSPSMVRSTVTVEPQRREWALAVASGAGAAQQRDVRGEFEDALVVDVAQHIVRSTGDWSDRLFMARSPCQYRVASRH